MGSSPIQVAMEKEIIAPGIIVYRNVMPESSELPNLISSSYGWYKGEAAKSRNKKIGYENVRKVKAYQLHDNDDEKILFWNNLVEEKLGACQKDYIEHYAIDTLSGNNTGYQILQYEPGDYFSEHTDDVPEQPRKISGVYYINDNYVGGELLFTLFNIEFKPKAHDYILFPSIWSYSHIAKQVESGVKNAIVHFLS